MSIGFWAFHFAQFENDLRFFIAAMFFGEVGAAFCAIVFAVLMYSVWVGKYSAKFYRPGGCLYGILDWAIFGSGLCFFISLLGMFEGDHPIDEVGMFFMAVFLSIFFIREIVKIYKKRGDLIYGKFSLRLADLSKPMPKIEPFHYSPPSGKEHHSR